MKRILFLSQNISPFRALWINELSKTYNITLYHLGEYHNSVNENYYNSVVFNKNIFVIDKKVNFFNFIFFDNKIIKNINYDICIFDGYGYAGAVKLLLSRIIPKDKLIISVDGGFIPSVVNNIKSDGFIPRKENFFKKSFKRLLMSRSKYFFSTSKDTDNFIIHYAGPNVKILRHFFSSITLSDIKSCEQQSESYNILRSKYKISSNDKIIIMVGRFIKSKNFEILLHSLKYLDKSYKLIIIGGVITDNYKTIIEQYGFNNDYKQYYNFSDISSISYRINFINFLSKNELINFYMLSDIFCMPTKHDAWGLVVLEAIAYAGLPIISSDMCLSAKALIKDGINGYIITDNSASLYSEKISLLSNRLNDYNYYLKVKKYNYEIINNYTIESSTKYDVENISKYF